MVFDVKDARRVVRALDVRAEPDKMIGLVAQHGTERDPAEKVRSHLHPFEELRHPGGLDALKILHARTRARPSSDLRTFPT